MMTCVTLSDGAGRIETPVDTVCVLFMGCFCTKQEGVAKKECIHNIMEVRGAHYPLTWGPNTTPL